MNEDAEEVSIPLTVDTDQAAANIEKLQSVAESLDSTLERLQQRAVQAFNSIGMSLSGQPYRADNYAQVETFSKAVGPEELWAQSPRLGRAMGEVDVHRDEVAARVGRFADANQTAVSTLTGPALYNAFQGSTPPPAPPAPPAPLQGTGTPVGGAAAAAALPPMGTAAPLPASASASPLVSSSTSTPPAAVDPLTRLRADAEALDPQLQTRETHATRLFNQLALTSGDGQPVKATRYADVRQHLSAFTPEETWDLSPALGQSLVGAEQRRAAIGARVEQFATTPAFGAVATPAGATTSPAPTATPPPAATATPPPAATPAPAPAAVFDAFSSWLDAQPARASSPRMPAIPNAFGTTAAPLPLGLGLGGGTTPQDTDRTATTFADKISSALTHSGGSVAASLTRGAFDAAGMGAAGDVVSGLARPVAGALGELFAPVAGVLAAVGVGLGINAQSSHYFAEEQTLAGGVGSRGGATPSSELTTAQQTGWGYLYHEKESVAAARQLGDAGVDSSQLGGTLSASMALARVGGMDLGATTQLSGQYARAGFSGSQISDTYAEMDQASRLTGVSLSRITAAIKELNQTAGLGAIGVSSFAATQAFVGPELHVEQALAPAIGAQGAEAIQMQAMLQLSPQDFLHAQKNPAQLWDAYAGVAKRYDRGTYGTDVAEQALKTAGLDLSSLKGPDAAAVVQRLVSQGPKAAEDYYTSLQTKEKAHPETGTDLTNKGVDVSNRIISAGDKLAIDAERAAAAFIRGADALGASASAAEVKQWQTAHPGQRRAEAFPGATVEGGFPARLPRDPFSKENAKPYETPDGHTKTVPGYVSGYGADTRWVDPRYVTPHAIPVDNTRGSTDYATPQVTGMVAGAAQYTHVPIGVSLALLARETDIKNVQGHGDGGYGIAQWDFSTQANQRNAMHYLGASSVAQAKQYAMDPQRAITASDTYLRDIYNDPTRGAHNWERTLASYNGSGPAAQQYGHDTYQAAQKVEIQIGGTVTLTHPDGKPAGTGQVKPQTHTIHHPVNHARKATAAASYAPTDHTPPAPPPRFHRFG